MNVLLCLGLIVTEAKAEPHNLPPPSKVKQFLHQLALTIGKTDPKYLPSPSVAYDFLDELDPNPIKVKLGRLLFFDKILSGNKNISCATCHHPLSGTGDGLSLSVGEGGRGLGVTRDIGEGEDIIHERVPRNAPPIFSLGVVAIDKMFHDGRVAIDESHPSGFLNPAGDDLPSGLENLLAVQAMFPVTSGTEMAGQPGENSVANAAALGDLKVQTECGAFWPSAFNRFQNISSYSKRCTELVEPRSPTFMQLMPLPPLKLTPGGPIILHLIGICVVTGKP